MLDKVLFKFIFPSALLSTEVTLELRDSSVNRLVHVKIALVRELLSTVGALVVFDLFMHGLLVFLQISGILRHVATYVTHIVLFQGHFHSSILHVHHVAVQLVIFEVAFSDGFFANLTLNILRGWGGFCLFIVVLQQPLVVFLCN